MAGIGRHVSRLGGYAPALPTPFGDSGDLDVAALERLCRRQLEEGATALVVCGTTGEAPTLSRAEHHTIVNVAAGVAQGQIPVIAGAGSNSTRQAIELARDAEVAGADAILSIVPYYNKPTQAGIYAHFRAIAESTSLPIILYDVPSRTVCGLADDTVARLAEMPQVIGLKDASGDACISVTSNVAPGLCRAMYLAWKQGQIARAQRLAAVAAPLTAALSRESNPVPVKYALSVMNMVSPRVRLPLVELTNPTMAEIDGVLAQLGALYSDYLIGSAF